MQCTENRLSRRAGYGKETCSWKPFVSLPDNPYVLKSDISSFKCLLVFLNKKTGSYCGDYPIALGYMASLLRMNGAGADILVQDVDSYDSDTFSDYDLICFYPMVALLNETMNYVSKVKGDNHSAKICFLNSEQHQHEMLFCSPRAVEIAENTMDHCHALDFILIGESEYSFIKLCENIAAGSNLFSDLPSCVYRDNGKIKVSTEKIRPVDFMYLPYPSRDFLEETISDENINSFSPRVQSSRGCLGRCLYCTESAANITSGGRTKPWVGRDIISFVDEIEQLARKYKVVFFNVIDSSFEDPGNEGLERMERFCSEIRARNLEVSFKIHLRFETVSKLSDEFLLMLKEAGVDVLILGAESGLEHELRSYRKRTTAQKTVDGCRRLNDSGRFFQLLGHMMFSPFLTLDDLPLKMEFLKKVRHGWDYMNVSNNVLAFNGTAYHDLIDKKGLTIKNKELNGTVSYRFQDERVQYVAEEMGRLKIKCPEIIYLNNHIYDALNIKTRYHNKMNRHLWVEEKTFNLFKENLQSQLNEIEEIYSSYFLSLVQLAGSEWNEDEAGGIYEKWIAGVIPSAEEKMKKLIHTLIADLQSRGLSTSKLFMKTWMSVINTEINTASGKT